MCGIFAVYQPKSSSKLSASQAVLAGLKRLEYRGYDSWGIAAVVSGRLERVRQVGQIGLVKSQELAWQTQISLGHTRWATHGGVIEANAHPHLAADASFAVVQNGIVENYAELREELERTGVQFTTSTDTEVIVRLLELESKKQQTIAQAVSRVMRQLTGRNVVGVLTNTGQLSVARQGSPLVVARDSQTGAVYISSDILSLSTMADQAMPLTNGQMVLTGTEVPGGVQLVSSADLSPVTLKFEPITITQQTITKSGYDSFMLKEIMETPEVIERVASVRFSSIKSLAQAVVKADHIYTIGSGTAGVAASQLAYYLRKKAGKPATALVGADAVEYCDLITDRDIVIAPSQSGETADVLEVLEQLKAKQVPIACYVNMVGSSMSALADYSFLAQAGPEICVLSTKVLSSQLAWGYLLSAAVGGEAAFEQAQQYLRVSARVIATELHNKKQRKILKKVAKQLAQHRDLFILGKGELYQVAREGMIKVIEGAYLHAHAIPAGDLKHYAITLMEQQVPVVVLTADDNSWPELLNAAHEVKARGATVIGVGPQRADMFDSWLATPPTKQAVPSLSTVVVLQLLAYELSTVLGHDVDHPRNIAKSVTVK